MSKTGKIFLSGGLILASGAYAWWHHSTEAESLAPATVALRQARLTSPDVVAPPPAESVTSAPVARPVMPPAAPPPVAAPPVARAKPKVETAKPKTQDRGLKDALIAGTPAPPPPPTLGPPPPPPPATADTVQPAQPAVASTGRYADGDFVGQSFDGEWGPVQVKVAVRGGNVAQVICIEYPYHRRRSEEISEYAIPILVEETIKAQDSKIDWVSQASYTSEQFQQSLASALLRAEKPPPT